MDTENFKSIVYAFYNDKLNKAVKKNDHLFNFPIMKVIIIVHVYNLFRIVIVIFAISYFLGIFWLIFVRDIQDWHNISETKFDVFQGYQSFYSLSGKNWIQDDGEEAPNEVVLI